MSIISLIIPVYNTSKYLDECLQSVINQSYEDIEIIVIDDGSTDCSKEIVSRYAREDKRIKHFTQVNIGLGPTRNKGISLANGEYLMFIDSDDFIDHNMVEKMYDQIKQNDCDIVCCQTVMFYANGSNLNKTRIVFKDDEIINVNDIGFEKLISNYFLTRLISYNACDKIFKSSFIKKNNIQFGDNKEIFAEDHYFMIQCISFLENIGFIKDDLYFYRQRNGSIMNSYKQNLLSRYMHFIYKIEQIIYQTAAINSHQRQQLMSLTAWDALTAESINILSSNRKIIDLSRSFKESFSNDMFKTRLTDVRRNGTLKLIQNKNKRLFIYLCSFFIEMNLYPITILLFYIKYNKGVMNE